MPVYAGEAPKLARGPGLPSCRDWRRTRYALRAGAECLDTRHHAIVTTLRRRRYRLWRAWDSKNNCATSTGPSIPPTPVTTSNGGAPPRCAAASWRSRTWSGASANTSAPSAPSSPRSNSARPTPLEGINAKIRFIQRRGYGHRNLHSLTAMIYLCLGGIAVTLPTQT